MKRTILVVDDSRTVRAALRLQLVADGWDVVEAENAERGLRLARLLRPRAVLVDMGLPDMDGSVLLRALRTASSDVRLVGFSGDDAEVRAREAGADAFMKKPVALEGLRLALAPLEGAA